MDERDLENVDLNIDDDQNAYGSNYSNPINNIQNRVDQVKNLTNNINDIKDRINASRNRNLNQNTNNLNGLDNVSSNELPSSRSSSLKPKNETLQNSSNLNKPDASLERAKGLNKSANTLNNAESVGQGSASINAADKASKAGTAAKTGETASKANTVAKADTAAKAGTATKAGTAAKASTAAKTGKAVKGVFSWKVILIIAIVIVAILFLLVLVAAVTSIFNTNNLSMKYGTSNTDAYETFTDTYEINGKTVSYHEGITRNELDTMYTTAKGNVCGEEGFFENLKSAFGLEDLSQANELCRYINKKLNQLEEEKKIYPLKPGYVLSSLYYAYDTQRYDEENHSYFKYTQEQSEDGSVNAINLTDMDIITILFANKVYNKSQLDDLFNNYILDAHNYYLYENTNDNSEEEATFSCVAHSIPASASEEKLMLYLRYGSDIADKYEEDKNNSDAYEKSSKECIAEKKLEKVDLTKYDTKIDLNNDSSEVPTIDGKYYTDGFIFRTYPKYAENGINGARVEVNNNYELSREVETIISNITARQDYTNYSLGYPSDILKKNQYTSVCNYNINGVDITNLKVRLLYGYAAPEGKNMYDPIETMDLIDFEDYILGVVHEEIGTMNYNPEAYKAQAIATRSYAIARARMMSGVTLEKENDYWVLSIRNGNEDQAYCDPEKTCVRRCVTGHGSNPNQPWCTYVPEDRIPEGWSAEDISSYKVPPLSETSPIREYVRSTAGIMMTGSDGYIVHSGYTNNTQNEFNRLANEGNDYLEILKAIYVPRTGDFTLNTSTCSAHLRGTLTEEQKLSHMNEILNQYPNLSLQRRTALEGALDTVGLPYFWGGGHSSLQNLLDIVENKWGKDYCTITASGSKYQAVGNSYLCGLDCTGFARWVLYKASGIDVFSSGTGFYVGNKYLEKVDASNILPGDVAVFPGHVAVYMYKNNKGQDVYVHASNGVQISTHGSLLHYFRLKDLP